MRKIIAMCMLLAAPGAASAQTVRSQSEGFYVNFHLNGSSIKTEDANDTESGGGGGLGIGYGFSPAVMLFLNVDGANINAVDSSPDYALAHADLGIRYTFVNRAHAWIPFLQAALAGRAAQWNGLANGEDVSVTGGGVTLGGGIGYHFSSAVALEGSIGWTVGKFTQGKVGGTTQDLGSDAFNATSARVNIGLSITPKK